MHRKWYQCPGAARPFGSRFVRFSAISVKPKPKNCAAVVASAAAPMASGMPGNRPLSAKGHKTRSPMQFARPANKIVYSGVFESFLAKCAAPQTADMKRYG